MVAIGIDLGTTYSCVGVWKDNRWYIRYVPKNFKSFSFIAEYEDNIKTKIFIEYNKDLIKNEATEENEKKDTSDSEVKSDASKEDIDVRKIAR